MNSTNHEGFSADPPMALLKRLQVRALQPTDAIEPAKELSRSSVNKLPAMILSNGLLATAAFCNAEGGGENRGGT